MRDLPRIFLLLALVGLYLDNLALRRQRRRLRAIMKQTGAELLAAALVQERAEAVLAARLAAAWRVCPVEDGDGPPILVEPLESRLN